MTLEQLLNDFHTIATSPSKQKDHYLSLGKKVVLTAPVYTPRELVHAMGCVPMGVWGGDVQLQEAKKYFPSFLCSIVQSMVELGMQGAYQGASAIIIPSLCDSLKVAGENWKYAVPSIPFIPMSYPQNRKPEFAIEYTLAGYRRVIADLQQATGCTFEEENLARSIAVYNAHRAAMRKAIALMGTGSAVSCRQRSDVIKSANFMLVEEHTALLDTLITLLQAQQGPQTKTPLYTTGILADAPALLDILDGNNLCIAADDVAAESRQYRTDVPAGDTPLRALALHFSMLDDCSVLYDAKKGRVQRLVREAQQANAKGVLVILTKFCDPEEFDYPLIQQACDAAALPCTVVEVDRQMGNYEQARTIVETFCDVIR